jgi:hypothetical protein
MNDKPLTHQQRATIAILLFIVKMLNPTGYTFEIKELKINIEDQLDLDTGKAE